MADKVSEANYATAVTVSSVSTVNGSYNSTTTNQMYVVFDESCEMAQTLDNLEKAKLQILDFYANKSS